jgi:hypothetical protein
MSLVMSACRNWSGKATAVRTSVPGSMTPIRCTLRDEGAGAHVGSQQQTDGADRSYSRRRAEAFGKAREIVKVAQHQRQRGGLLLRTRDGLDERPIER